MQNKHLHLSEIKAEKENKIDILVDGQLFSGYHTDPNLLKPCLHPVFSPSGEILTRKYPFEEVEGEKNASRISPGTKVTKPRNQSSATTVKRWSSSWENQETKLGRGMVC